MVGSSGNDSIEPSNSAIYSCHNGPPRHSILGSIFLNIVFQRPSSYSELRATLPRRLLSGGKPTLGDGMYVGSALRVGQPEPLWLATIEQGAYDLRHERSESSDAGVRRAFPDREVGDLSGFPALHNDRRPCVRTSAPISIKAASRAGFHTWRHLGRSSVRMFLAEAQACTNNLTNGRFGHTRKHGRRSRDGRCRVERRTSVLAVRELVAELKAEYEGTEAADSLARA